VGTNLAALGAILGNEEYVLRGLNPKHCEEDGLPTEDCFVLSRTHPIDDGESFGIFIAEQADVDTRPLGAAHGVTVDIFSTLIPSPNYGVSLLKVADALEPVRERNIAFIQKDEDLWGAYRSAHAMLTGYQEQFTKQERREIVRHLTKLAAKSIVKTPTTSG
jgi:hypothetical protein